MQGNRPATIGMPAATGDTIRRWREFQQTKLYDFLAAAPIIFWFSVTIGNSILVLLPVLQGLSLAALTTQAAVALMARISSIAFLALALILLTIRRTPVLKSKGLMPRVTAFAGTFLMTLIMWVEPTPMPVAVNFASVVLTLGGMCFSIYSLMHLGRSFSLMPEARRLVTNGPYASIRHPLYLGEAVSMTGVVLQFLSPAGIAIFFLHLAFQLQRIVNEEKILAAQFPEYADYRARTARLLPGIY
jgi:protein-S-isoprenylcysteine O-methyltransferase Ste14